MRDEPGPRRTRAVLTVPNLLSFGRILLIPLIVSLLLREGSEGAGLLLWGFVSATDFVDGAIARRTGQVSELGKVLDPTADRLVIDAGVVAIVIRGAFPLWAALLILVRDLLILLAGLMLLTHHRGRIDVRWIGKVATFGLMVGVPLVAWGHFGLALPAAATALGWTFFVVGIVEYYAATALYIGDLRRAFAR
ncbi:MAG TPA: CDP-alcohol phosphatidyltransferase family protein [Actinomycetota bacterium]|nr:CDP-alcohol phosphatidyltransferase family protein [Actinomycetota bacterium]